MTKETVDIVVSGGGLAGMMAAAVFGHAGFRVLLADPAAPVTEAEADGSDLRSTAFLRPSRDLLERVGVWPVLAPHATSLEVLEAVDSTGWPPVIRERRAFRADDLGSDPFGWNLMNWLTKRELLTVLKARPEITLAYGTGIRDILTREREAIVTLDDGRRLRARLVIGADGRNSIVRAAAGIGAETIRYGQKALAFTVTHPVPHENVSTEIYNDGGAFTMVPLEDQDGQAASAIVWMNPGPKVQALAALDREAFENEATTRSCHLFGPLSLQSPLRVFPVITQTAERLTAERVALVAEAAHVLPPIGAQGLNTSLHDVATLFALAEAAPDDLGSAKMLAAYEKTRSRDIALRARVIDLFNRICRSGEAPVQAMRRAGLKAVYDIAPVRRGVMKAGLGG